MRENLSAASSIIWVVAADADWDMVVTGGVLELVRIKSWVPERLELNVLKVRNTG